MAYNSYSSNSVNVFPSTGRTLVPDGKFTSESNFTNIVNCLTDDFKKIVGTNIVKNDGYLLDNVVEGSETTIKVVIHGYYFELTGVSTSSGSPLWLGIAIRDTDNRLVAFDHTNTLDTSTTLLQSNFTGLVYVNSEDDVTGSGDDNFTHYWLKVYDGANWVNKVRIDSDVVNYSYNSSSEDATITVKEELDSLESDKQENVVLESDSGLVWKNSDNKTLRINQDHLDHLNTIEGKTIGNNNPTLIKFTNGIPAANDNVDVGSGFADGSAQNVYVKDGVLTPGQKIYVSTAAPGNTVANVGDLWFRYSND